MGSMVCRLAPMPLLLYWKYTGARRDFVLSSIVGVAVARPTAVVLAACWMVYVSWYCTLSLCHRSGSNICHRCIRGKIGGQDFRNNILILADISPKSHPSSVHIADQRLLNNNLDYKIYCIQRDPTHMACVQQQFARIADILFYQMNYIWTGCINHKMEIISNTLSNKARYWYLVAREW